MVQLADDPFEFIAPVVCIGSFLLMPLGPIFLPRFWILFMAGYFLVFLGTQINHLAKFYMTAQQMKKTINEYNAKLKSQDHEKLNCVIVATDSDLTDMESSLVNTYDNDFLVHAFVIPNYAEPEALMRDTIGRIAVHKYVKSVLCSSGQ